MFFCLLTSGLEYLPQSQEIRTNANEISQNESENNENQTFISVSVDAVVPFAVALSQQILHVIYELVFVEKSTITTVVSKIAKNFHFREILLERIISTNAP